MEYWRRNTALICGIVLIIGLLSGCCGPDRKSSESIVQTEHMTPAAAVEEPAGLITTPVRDESLMRAASEAGALATVYFDFDRSDIKPPADSILRGSAAWLLKNPGVVITIAGHADERGTNEYNMALGERRAHSAKKYLVDQGIPSTRLTTVSYGEERPADPGHDEAAWSRNRRAEFAVYQ